MTWLQRIRPLRLRFALYLIGAVVMIGSLLGAKVLTGGHDENAKAESPGGNTSKITGPIVLGTVDSNPQPISYGLPPVLQSGTIMEVLVKDGAEVQADQKLYIFDTSIQQCDLEQANVAAEMARSKVATAKEVEIQHTKKVKLLEEAVKIAKRKKEFNSDKYDLIKNNLEKSYGTGGFAKTTWPDRLKNEVQLFEASADCNLSLSEWELKKEELDLLKASDISLLVKEAQIGVKQAESQVNKARTAVDLCIVRAKTPGTIEQVTISRGSTIGISTPKPALWLIPAGPRIVRAEIEADFAHRVSASLKGKEVTIFDNTDPKLTYKGRVQRIGTAFLLKRSSEAFLGSDTRVLEAEIEVIDANPADRPPLRIGQRVRVDLGQ